MARTLRILALALPLGLLSIGLLWLRYRPATPSWSDHISVRYLWSDSDITGSWALNCPAGFTGTALQLQNGEYRYWRYTDVGPPFNLTARGRYSIRFGRLHLEPSPIPTQEDGILVYGEHAGLVGLWFDHALLDVGQHRDSLGVRMLRRVSPSIDPEHPIYNHPAVPPILPVRSNR